MSNITINELATVLPLLSDSDQAFAASLISNGRKYGCSAKQAMWVEKLYLRATQPAAPRETVELGSFSGMISLFDTAKTRLKNPKITLTTDADGEFEVTVAGARAKVPGSLNVSTPGGYGVGTWFGRILQNGKFEISPRQQPSASLLALLTAFAADPACTAAEYGRKSGKCCFCHKSLTDGRSVEVGYGRKCAQNFGLQWGK